MGAPFVKERALEQVLLERQEAFRSTRLQVAASVRQPDGRRVGRRQEIETMA